LGLGLFVSLVLGVAALPPVQPVISQRLVYQVVDGLPNPSSVSEWEVTLSPPSNDSQPLSAVSLRIEDDPTAIITGVVKQPNGTRSLLATFTGTSL
jgi:hypothetical protein